jgi:hypothetical protein
MNLGNRCWLAATVLFIAAAAVAEERITTAARTIFKAHQDSVICVSALSTLSIQTSGGPGPRSAPPDQEKKLETQGTIVDPSGLVAVSLTSIDPSVAVSGREIESPMGTVKILAHSKMKDIKLILPDGTEVPADIVLKDVDLDLAFLKARSDAKEAKGVAFTSIDLKKQAEAHVLDEVVVLGRTPQSFCRQPSVTPSWVTAVMTTPRTFYQVPATGAGMPVFNAEGSFLGINVLRHSKTENSFLPPELGMMPAVLPASDVASCVAQALKAKPLTDGDIKEPASPK